MKEHPILFMPEMVQAYYASEKWQTRRIIKPQPPASYRFYGYDSDDKNTTAVFGKYNKEIRAKCRYGKPGDLLWVKETWGYVESEPEIYYRADDIKTTWRVDKWHPSIYMPRRISRISFPILSIRAERVQDISVQDCYAEGAVDYRSIGPRSCYQRLWDKINAKRGYAWNTRLWWVWVIEFPKYEVVK